MTTPKSAEISRDIVAALIDGMSDGETGFASHAFMRDFLRNHADAVIRGILAPVVDAPRFGIVEAVAAAKEGKRVRPVAWRDNEVDRDYYLFSRDGWLRTQKIGAKNYSKQVILSNDEITGEWEIVPAPETEKP